MIKKEKAIAIIGGAPPPVNGQSVYYEYLLNLFSDFERAQVPIVTRDKNRGFVGHLDKLISVIRALVSISRSRNIGNAIIIVDSGYGQVYSLCIAFLLRIKNVNNIFLSYHSFEIVRKKSFLINLISKLLGSRGVHLFLCNKMLDEFSRTYACSIRSIVINNAARVSAEAEFWSGGSVKEFTIGYLSNVSFEKGIVEFVGLYDLMIKNGYKVKAIVAGGASDQATDQFLTSALKERPDLQWLGPVYGEGKRKFFQSISTFVFPTKYGPEAQPNVVLEALSAGVPVISTQRGCIPDDIQDSLIAVSEEHFASNAFPAASALYSLHREGRFDEVRKQARSRFEKLKADAEASEQAIIEIVAAKVKTS